MQAHTQPNRQMSVTGVRVQKRRYHYEISREGGEHTASLKGYQTAISTPLPPPPKRVLPGATAPRCSTVGYPINQPEVSGGVFSQAGMIGSEGRRGPAGEMPLVSSGDPST